MCEHCRNRANSKEIRANFTYTKSEAGESESRSMVSKILNRSELGEVVHHLLVGLKTYADRLCDIPPPEFDRIVSSYLSVESLQEEPLIMEADPIKLPMYLN